MRIRLMSFSYAIVAAATIGVVSLLLVATPAAQQGAPAAEPEETPRLSNGRPDFSGFYGNSDRFLGDSIEETPGFHVVTRAPDGSIFYDYAGANLPQLAATGQKDNQPPYKPEYMEKVKAIAATMYGGNTTLDPQYDCKPSGVPRLGYGYTQIVHRHDMMAILWEKSPGTDYRVIYTDGRPHPGPDDLDTSYMGHSIGHWEGDTLVVDVIGLNDETWLGGAQTGDRKLTSIHSDQLHVVERWTREGSRITVETTVEDPVMFTRPWVMDTKGATIAASWDWIQPYMCVDISGDHTISPSPEDPDLICGWCNQESVYGLDSNKITNQDTTTDDQRRRAEAQGR